MPCQVILKYIGQNALYFSKNLILTGANPTQKLIKNQFYALIGIPSIPATSSSTVLRWMVMKRQIVTSSADEQCRTPLIVDLWPS